MAEHRQTRQRQIVLETVRSRRDHPTAEDIFDEVRENDPRISRGTVYRNLNCLARDEELTRVGVPGGADRFDLRTDRHYHLRCVVCGSVSDAPLEYVSEFDRQAAERTGYAIKSHSVIFEGICPDCRGKKGNH